MEQYGHNMTESKLRVGGSAVQVVISIFSTECIVRVPLGHFC